MTCIEQALLQNLVFFHRSIKSFFPHSLFWQTISTRGTLIKPLCGLRFPFKLSAILCLVSKLKAPLSLFVTCALQLEEQYFLGSLGQTSNETEQPGRIHVRISLLRRKSNRPRSQATFVLC